MKKFTQVLQVVLLVFFSAFTIFFIAFDTLGSLFGMSEISSDNMATIMLTGMVIFLFTWLFAYLTITRQSEKMDKKELEMNKLKAKLYDLEHPEEPVKKPQPKVEDTSFIDPEPTSE